MENIQIWLGKRLCKWNENKYQTGLFMLTHITGNNKKKKYLHLSTTKFWCNIYVRTGSVFKTLLAFAKQKKMLLFMLPFVLKLYIKISSAYINDKIAIHFNYAARLWKKTLPEDQKRLLVMKHGVLDPKGGAKQPGFNKRRACISGESQNQTRSNWGIKEFNTTAA